MATVFVGGSRRISRLDDAIRRRLDSIIKNNLQVVVGDANGADKSVQEYLRLRNYKRVQVFCASSNCRNNLGDWTVREVQSRARKGTATFYASKDREMAAEAHYGLMLWDGKSIGTLVNVSRLTLQGKRVILYVVPERRFCTLRGPSDWDQFLNRYDSELRAQLAKRESTEENPVLPGLAF